MFLVFSIVFVLSFIVCLVVALNMDHFLSSKNTFIGIEFLLAAVAFVPLLNTYAAIILINDFYRGKMKND